jgi:hypothetical protein
MLVNSASWISFVANPFVLAGYALYGSSMILLTIALKEAELSFLYPFIAITFVWVTILHTHSFLDRFLQLRSIIRRDFDRHWSEPDRLWGEACGLNRGRLG